MSALDDVRAAFRADLARMLAGRPMWNDWALLVMYARVLNRARARELATQQPVANGAK